QVCVPTTRVEKRTYNVVIPTIRTEERVQNVTVCDRVPVTHSAQVTSYAHVAVAGCGHHGCCGPAYQCVPVTKTVNYVTYQNVPPTIQQKDNVNVCDYRTETRTQDVSVVEYQTKLEKRQVPVTTMELQTQKRQVQVTEYTTKEEKRQVAVQSCEYKTEKRQ